MRVLIASLAWLAAFAAIGAAAMLGFGWAVFHHLAHIRLKLAGLGAEFGGDLFAFGFCFALLPGARRRPGALGLVQGIWAMIGFGIMMAAGGALLANVLTIVNFIALAGHRPLPIDFSGRRFLLGTVCVGELAASAWAIWYFCRFGPERRADGGASGLAWRAASPAAYLTATACALGIIAVVLTLYHFMPPDLLRLQALPMEKLFTGSPAMVAPILLIAIFIGPALEELVFRGIAFAGIAARLGPLWAGVITTLAFMAAHTPEKIHYPPGFIDVGLVAVATVLLRLRFRSIRPGIALHILYNLGSMLAASLFR